ncbi:hypothetical protein F5B20DRAFT_589645 [Whalleya microplaca]|nr:hypothetical protein F5B20DRAFT_589645 [Whalleya microplaca]
MAGYPPGPTFTPGLDFSSKVYGSRRASADAVYLQAVDVIKKKLPLMGQLKALLEVNLGDDRPLVIIDGRSGEPKLLETTSEEPDTQLTIKPEIIIQFYEGKLEPRYGLFKDAFFHEALMPKGKIPVAVKFADLLTPIVPEEPTPYSPGMELPQPTEDIEQVKRDLKKFGYGLVKNALTRSQVAILRRALEQQAAGEEKAGIAAHDGGPKGVNQRVWTLVNKGDEFLDFLNHPLIDAIVPWFLGEHALCHSFTANIARPGNVPMQLHTDQVAIQPPNRDIPFGLNIMWFLEDVTEENGGTRVFPGSHVGAIAPTDIFTIEGTVAAEGPVGTAMLFESRIWHATGANKSKSGSDRPVLLTLFMRSFVRGQENNFLSLRPEVEAKLSNRLKRLLGFCTTGAVGGVEGEIREGTYVKKVENPCGPLRDSIAV